MPLSIDMVSNGRKLAAARIAVTRKSDSSENKLVVLKLDMPED
tara:strand:+ start:402 stop:530 length:129 start_codon:yes stop_codon:yes gene_type:complete